MLKEYSTSRLGVERGDSASSRSARSDPGGGLRVRNALHARPTTDKARSAYRHDLTPLFCYSSAIRTRATL